jgi:hypothetical protein
MPFPMTISTKKNKILGGVGSAQTDRFLVMYFKPTKVKPFSLCRTGPFSVTPLMATVGASAAMLFVNHCLGPLWEGFP